MKLVDLAEWRKHYERWTAELRILKDFDRGIFTAMNHTEFWLERQPEVDRVGNFVRCSECVFAEEVALGVICRRAHNAIFSAWSFCSEGVKRP